MPIETTPSYAAFAGALADWSAEDVFELERQVNELRSHPGYIGVNELMEGGRAVVQRNLELVPHDSAATYARFLGFIAGTRILPELLDVVVRYADERRELIAEREAEEQRGRAKEAAA